MKNFTPDQQTMLATWQQHTYAEFVLKDADAALATMTENHHVLLIGSGVVRVGRAAVREFYADKFLPNIPSDLEITTLSQTFGDDRMCEEMAVRQPVRRKDGAQDKRRPWRTAIPRSNRKARIRLIMPVRWLTSRSRTRCSACKSSCSAVLVATNFMVGRCTASAISPGEIPRHDGLTELIEHLSAFAKLAQHAPQLKANFEGLLQCGVIGVLMETVTLLAAKSWRGLHCSCGRVHRGSRHARAA
jgi:hypothetical protein